MPSYLTDQQIAALGLSGTPTQIAATLNDAETVYAYLQANPWATDNDASAWAQTALPAQGSTTPAQRLQAASAVLLKVGRIRALTSSYQPAPPATG